MENMSFAVIFGTRPEIIKLAPLIRFMERNNEKLILINTGQHYDENMSDLFLKELELSEPDVNLNIRSATHGYQTANIIKKVESELLYYKIKYIIIQGDTNTTLGSALAAIKLGVKIIHVEAGLRSFDMTLPEEINRILVDRIADICFAPTKLQKQFLLNEGVDEEKIKVVGNTIIDSINFIKNQDEKVSKMINEKENYDVLITIHRVKNTVNQSKLMEILFCINKMLSDNNLKAVFPIHPRTKKLIKKEVIFNRIHFMQPVHYGKIIDLIANSKFIITDSGGLQEEACILNTPCITLRNSTERQETLNLNSNKLVKTINELNLNDAVIWALNNDVSWEHPYGENVSSKIYQIIKNIGDYKL